MHHVNFRPTIDGEAIREPRALRFLGAHANKNPKFRKHITEVKSQCANCIHMLQSLAGSSWSEERRTILHLYKAIVRPIIDCCSFVYQFSLTNSQSKKIESIQNVCIRIAAQPEPWRRGGGISPGRAPWSRGPLPKNEN